MRYGCCQNIHYLMLAHGKLCLSTNYFGKAVSECTFPPADQPPFNFKSAGKSDVRVRTKALFWFQPEFLACTNSSINVDLKNRTSNAFTPYPPP